MPNVVVAMDICEVGSCRMSTPSIPWHLAVCDDLTFVISEKCLSAGIHDDSLVTLSKGCGCEALWIFLPMVSVTLSMFSAKTKEHCAPIEVFGFGCRRGEQDCHL